MDLNHTKLLDLPATRANFFFSWLLLQPVPFNTG